MSATNHLKAQAKRLRHHLADRQISLSHSEALEAIAAMHGFRDWNTAAKAGPAAHSSKVVTPDVYRELDALGREHLLRVDISDSLRNSLLRQIAVIDQMGPPGTIDSARKMLASLNDGRLPEAVANEVRGYLFALPGMFYGWHAEAETLHQELLALRASEA